MSTLRECRVCRRLTRFGRLLGRGPKKEETPGGKGKITRKKVKRCCTLSYLCLVMVPVFFNIYLLFPLGPAMSVPTCHPAVTIIQSVLLPRKEIAPWGLCQRLPNGIKWVLRC